ncbi:MAG: bifunctional folylpolyglutamate synthase/dihydrofolate synthase [Myxococcales bacterium]|nr:bifunctional folylpolyglutamate synthase/dihydrofolate synthase [Myxococcales bacterium]
MYYSQAIEFLYGLQGRGIKLGLERIERALQERGQPHKRLHFAHVAGTNGKGSVSAMLASCLTAAGLRTGLFTSPHLHRFTERIQINGKELSEDSVARRLSELATWQQQQSLELSFFEMATLLALEAFVDEGCDMVVMETGLGGRLDSTNVIFPEVCVITHIARDHSEILGDDLATIASEKAGIIKKGRPVILGSSPDEALTVLIARARALDAPAVLWNRDIVVTDGTEERFSVRIHDEILSDLFVALRGSHQRHNAALAVGACVTLRQLGWSIPSEAIRAGLSSTTWPGRLEFLASVPKVLLDAAHNPDGCQALADYVRSIQHAFSRLVLVFGCMQDKDARAMLACFRGLFAQHFYVAPPMSRAMAPGALDAISPGASCEGIADALSRAQDLAGPQGLFVVAGSIFVVAEARRLLLGNATDPLIGM